MRNDFKDSSWGLIASATAFDDNSLAVNPSERLQNLVQQIEYADQVGLDVFGVGEHHRREFLDSAPVVVLAALAARTKHIRLTSAVTVLSAADQYGFFKNSQPSIYCRRVGRR